jgi:hypothetical protein
MIKKGTRTGTEDHLLKVTEKEGFSNSVPKESHSTIKVCIVEWRTPISQDPRSSDTQNQGLMMTV